MRWPQTRSGQGTATRWGAAPRAALYVGACVSWACTPPQTAPKPEREPDIYTTQFVMIEGRDTLALEIVTYCLGRLIGDVSGRKPVGYVHYELEFGASKIPRNLTFAVWTSPDS